jgi:hypothetical protein
MPLVHLKCPDPQFFFFDRSPLTEDEFLDVASVSSESVWQYGFIHSFSASTIRKGVAILLWSGRDCNFPRMYTESSQFQSGFVHRCGQPAFSSSSCSWSLFLIRIQAKVECAYEGPVSLSVCERPVKSVTRTPVQQILFRRARLAFFFHLVPCFLLFISLVFSLPSSKLSCGCRIFIEQKSSLKLTLLSPTRNLFWQTNIRTHHVHSSTLSAPPTCFGDYFCVYGVCICCFCKLNTYLHCMEWTTLSY